MDNKIFPQETIDPIVAKVKSGDERSARHDTGRAATCSGRRKGDKHLRTKHDGPSISTRKDKIERKTC